VSETQQDSSRHRFCPSCGSAAQKGFRYCGRCGQSLVVGEAEDVEPQNTKVEPKVVAVLRRYRCIDCRTEIDGDQESRRCPRCNGPLVAVVRGENPAAATTAPVNVRVVTPRATSGPQRLDREQSKNRNPVRTTLLVILVVVVVPAGLIFVIPKLRNATPGVRNLFASNASTGSTGTGSGSPQSFIGDIESNVPALVPHIGSGRYLVTTSMLIADGNARCNTISSEVQMGESTQYAYNTAMDWEPGTPSRDYIPLSEHDVEVFIKYSIRDLCPSLISDIPYGYPGSSP